MCGILGVYRIGGVTSADLYKLAGLVTLNQKRGPVAYGIVSPKKLFKYITPPRITFNFLNENFLNERFVFIHLRAPTGEGENNLELTQPFVFDNQILLFNGILTEWDKEKYKNDTYEVFQRLREGRMEKLKGSFAICYVTPNRTVYLMRCINSLFYDQNFFSSERFEGSTELKHGQGINFISKELFEFDAYTPYDMGESDSPPKGL